MRILVTGGAGFIGSNFILKQLRETEHTLLNLDKLTYAGNKANLRSVETHPRYTFVQGDITHSSLVENLLKDFSPEILIHFAAESHVDRSIEGPLEFVHTNVLGTAVLLKTALEYWHTHTKPEDFRFLHVSTDEVYGSLGPEGYFTEMTPYDPSSPYSASKAGSDHLVRAWHRTYGFPALITNCSNNYGPYQFPEKLIPLMIVNCLDEKPLPVYGKGLNVRDWLYVEDHCDALATVMLKGQPGVTYNIGGHNEKQNIEIVEIICTLLDELRPRSSGKSYHELITFVEDRPGHDLRYAIDAGKIQRELGWKPKETFDTGIRKTIQWYLDHEDWWREIQEKKYNQERLGINKKSEARNQKTD